MTVWLVTRCEKVELAPVEIFKILFLQLSSGAALPPIEKPLRITSLIIRSKKINLTLFPDDEDEDDDELMYASSTHHHHRCCIVPSDLVTLRYSRKYFIPSTSIVA